MAILWAGMHCCRHRGDPALPLHVQTALQGQQESLGGSMWAVTLWQQKIMQAVITQGQARLSVLAATWAGSVAVSQRWQHQVPPGEVLLQCRACPAAIS